MKLLLCLECHDVVKFGSRDWRSCQCGLSAARYTNNVDGEMKGPAIPIGFSNPSLVWAIRNRPEEGRGAEFVGFVIPKKCDTIKVIE